MGKVWKYNPFYWIAKHKMHFSCERIMAPMALAKETTQRETDYFSGFGENIRIDYTDNSHKRNFSLKHTWDWHNLNPFRWSRRAIRVFTTGFFAVMLPIYIFIGMQPASSINTEGLPTLVVPSIGLETPVSTLELTNQELIAPANIAGSYASAENKFFIIGHSSTVFRKLDRAEVGDVVDYDGAKYRIDKREILEKAQINMYDILAPSETPTLVIMTCAGENLPNQDATHRLILTAEILED